MTSIGSTGGATMPAYVAPANSADATATDVNATAIGAAATYESTQAGAGADSLMERRLHARMGGKEDDGAADSAPTGRRPLHGRDDPDEFARMWGDLSPRQRRQFRNFLFIAAMQALARR